jgi:hypothetical protein
MLYTQARHGMGWLPTADMSGIFASSLADFQPSKYILNINKGEREMKSTFVARARQAIKSATGGLLFMDAGISDVGQHHVSKDLDLDRGTHVEHGTMNTEPGLSTSTSVAAFFVPTTTPYLQFPEAAPNASDEVDADFVAQEFNPAQKKEGFQHLFKMNPNHDKAGLFASGSGITPPMDER